jgi:hypothetical protein
MYVQGSWHSKGSWLSNLFSKLGESGPVRTTILSTQHLWYIIGPVVVEEYHKTLAFFLVVAHAANEPRQSSKEEEFRA